MNEEDSQGFAYFLIAEASFPAGAVLFGVERFHESPFQNGKYRLVLWSVYEEKANLELRNPEKASCRGAENAAGAYLAICNRKDERFSPFLFLPS